MTCIQFPSFSTFIGILKSKIAGKILNIQKVIITKKKKGRSKRENTMIIDYWMSVAVNQANAIGDRVRVLVRLSEKSQKEKKRRNENIDLVVAPMKADECCCMLH